MAVVVLPRRPNFMVLDQIPALHQILVLRPIPLLRQVMVLGKIPGPRNIPALLNPELTGGVRPFRDAPVVRCPETLELG